MSENERQRRILVVDDESPIAEMVGEFCNNFGFSTKILESGRDAVSEARAFAPDLILLDLLMPDLSGQEVLRDLKSDEDTKNIPVLIVSVAADAEKTSEVLQLAQGFLSKPVHMTQLKEKIETLLP